MASRRLVRQAAVQLLYARFASPKDQGGPEFWDLVNDKAALDLDRARVKVLSHLQQGREALIEKLQRLLTECVTAILAADPTEKTSSRPQSSHRSGALVGRRLRQPSPVD